MARVTISNLVKSYGAHAAVKGISLDIADGEFAVLVGPSGCGKSTLLRTIAGLEEASGGEISIGGMIVNDMRPRDRDVAMVFQDYALYPHMTVERNIGFGLQARKFPAAEIEARVKRAAEMLGIVPFLQRYPRQLSGGQRQRVAIGRAIVRNPQVFLFDEPLSNLDAQLRDEMRTEIKRLHREIGATMIYVTHDQIEAMTLADRIVLMRDGHIEQEGKPLDLFERPATKFVAGFLGSPKINFIPAVVKAEALELEDGAVLPMPSGAEAAEGQTVILGVRPQHISRAGKSVADGHVRLPVKVELVQPTGTRVHITFPLGGASAVAELGAHDVQTPGEKIMLDFDMSRAILIDSRSEKVLWS
jgi:multiple sugar transport system ATP-binding protein